MTEKELKKLKRIDLLELMLEQAQEIDRLKDIIKDQEARLADRAIKIQNIGSIAEACVAINNVMEAAQAAADQYLVNVKLLCEAQTENVLPEESIVETNEEASEGSSEEASEVASEEAPEIETKDSSEE